MLKSKTTAAIFALAVSFSFSSVTAAQTASRLDLASARKIAGKAFEYAAGKGWRISVAIVNDEGNLMLFERGDGSYSGSVDAAIQKAKTSNAFQRPTSDLANAVAGGRHGLLSIDGLVAVEGGVPVKIGGAHTGAIGISGAKAVEDEECANFAVSETPKTL